MILDSSAVIAILRVEPGFEPIVAALVRADRRAVSAASWFEASIIVDARGTEAARADFDAFFDRHRVEIVPVTPDHARRARTAYRTYGKGNHSAALNFGDCFSYALPQERSEPLLFIGNDFSRTDVTPAL